MNFTIANMLLTPLQIFILCSTGCVVILQVIADLRQAYMRTYPSQIILTIRDDMVIKGGLALQSAFICAGQVFRVHNLSYLVNFIFPLSLIFSVCWLGVAVALNYQYDKRMKNSSLDGDGEITLDEIRNIVLNAFCGTCIPLVTLFFGVLYSSIILLDENEHPSDLNSLYLPIAFGYGEMFVLIAGISGLWKGVRIKTSSNTNDSTSI